MKKPTPALLACWLLALSTSAGCSSQQPSPGPSTADSSASTASTPVASTATPGEASWTDLTLARALDGRTVGGAKLETMPPTQMDQVTTSLNQTNEVVARSDVDPAGCRTATATTAADLRSDVARSLAGANSLPYMVMVRAQRDAATAAKVVADHTATQKACARSSMRLTEDGRTWTATTTATLADLREVPGATVSTTTLTTQGRTTTQKVAVAAHGDLVIQALSIDGRATDAQLAQGLRGAMAALG